MKQNNNNNNRWLSTNSDSGHYKENIKNIPIYNNIKIENVYSFISTVEDFYCILFDFRSATDVYSRNFLRRFVKH